MNPQMVLFLVENAIKLNRMRSGGTQGPYEFGIINPYKQWPSAPKRLPFMDRPFGPGYQTLPEMSRSGFGPALGVLVRPLVVPAALVTTAVLSTDIEIVVLDEIVSTESVPASDKIRFMQGLSYY